MDKEQGGLRKRSKTKEETKAELECGAHAGLSLACPLLVHNLHDKL
jgi:hypothetical protein